MIDNYQREDSPTTTPSFSFSFSTNGMKMKKPTSKHRLSTENAVPVFLRKTYTMMNTCDTDIASWSDDGTMIVIKDTELFASSIIPQHFKHNNLSSFVRQLNFYGFRKLRTTHDDDDPEFHYWFFHHDNFLRDRPDLLCKIRKSTATHHSSTAKDQQATTSARATQEEVDALKAEVSTLKACIATMSSDMKKLAFVVQTMYNEKKRQQPEQSDYENNDNSPSKKTRLEVAPPEEVHSHHESSMATQQDLAAASNADLLLEDDDDGSGHKRLESTSSLFSVFGNIYEIEDISSSDADILLDGALKSR